MRVRKKKNFERRWQAVGALLETQPDENRGQWAARYATSDTPLIVELGCGKGKFLTGSAMAHPDCLYVGVERVKEVLLMTMERAVRLSIGNVRCIEGDVSHIEEMFAPGELSRLHIHFCDPWSSGKKAKRRLTHRTFLEKYRRLLKNGGEIRFKTDNEGLFTFSREEFESSGFDVIFCSEDWHNDPGFPDDDIKTEYETRFSEQGLPIYRLVARKTEG